VFLVCIELFHYVKFDCRITISSCNYVSARYNKRMNERNHSYIQCILVIPCASQSTRVVSYRSLFFSHSSQLQSEVRFDLTDVTRLSTVCRWRLSAASVPQAKAVDSHLDVSEIMARTGERGETDSSLLVDLWAVTAATTWWHATSTPGPDMRQRLSSGGDHRTR